MLDLITLLIILACVAVGYRRGLIETALRIVIFFVAIMFARTLHGATADFLRGTAFYNTVYEWLSGYIDFGAGIGTYLVINVAAAVVLLFFFTVVLNLVLSLLRVVNWIPFVGGLNRMLGAVAGLVFGFLTVWAVLMVYQLFSDGYGLQTAPLTGWLAQHNPLLPVIMGAFS